MGKKSCIRSIWVAIAMLAALVMVSTAADLALHAINPGHLQHGHGRQIPF